MNRLLIITLVIILLAACSEPEVETLPPEEIISRSAERMANTAGFQFNIQVSGQPVSLDGTGTLSLGDSQGFYVSPDKAVADVNVLAPGLVTQVSLISIGEEQWLSGLVSDEWIALPPEWGFNPASLIDSQTGLLSTLTQNLSNLSLVGTEKIDDGPDAAMYLIQAELDSDRLGQMSQGILGPGRLGIRMWIAPDTFELYRVILTDPGLDSSAEETESESIWQIDFSRFDEAIDISPPN